MLLCEVQGRSCGLFVTIDQNADKLQDWTKKNVPLLRKRFDWTSAFRQVDFIHMNSLEASAQPRGRPRITVFHKNVLHSREFPNKKRQRSEHSTKQTSPAVTIGYSHSSGEFDKSQKWIENRQVLRWSSAAQRRSFCLQNKRGKCSPGKLFPIPQCEGRPRKVVSDFATWQLSYEFVSWSREISRSARIPFKRWTFASPLSIRTSSPSPSRLLKRFSIY